MSQVLIATHSTLAEGFASAIRFFKIFVSPRVSPLPADFRFA